MREARAKREMEAQRSCLYADLYQMCGQMTVKSVEAICRKIHNLTIKIHSFKGGLHDINA